MMHSTLGVEQAAGQQGWMHWLVEFARPFRMPDFFLISGLFLASVINRDWRTYDWVVRHNDVVKLIKERQPHVLFLGDSITHYFGGDPVAPYRRGEETWQKYYEKRNALNMGFGWDRTENLLWRIQHGELEGVSPKLIVADNTAIKSLAALYEKTPLETLKTWQRFKVADQAGNYLSKRFVDSRFAFTKTLNGAKELRPRWRRGINEVDGRLGELLGETYVQRYFPAQSKAAMEELVGNLKRAAAERIKANSWMEQATKQAALTKLARMDVMVGYPEKFRDFSGLQMKADDLYGNVKRSAAFEWDYQLSDLGKPVDRKKWSMSPATVNAYNAGLENKIVFPAGILQPPFFDVSADAAANYGAIGAIIGHEIMHGFDDQGRKIDANGGPPQALCDAVSGRGWASRITSASEGSCPTDARKICSSVRLASQRCTSRLHKEPSDLRPITPVRKICTNVRSILPSSITRSKMRSQSAASSAVRRPVGSFANLPCAR